jgi:hypothetical protein
MQVLKGMQARTDNDIKELFGLTKLRELKIDVPHLGSELMEAFASI